MTTNQLKFQDLNRQERELVETSRANRERERETNRSNLAKEAETFRSNKVKEQETARHNKHQEIAGYINAGSNVVKSTGSMLKALL